MSESLLAGGFFFIIMMLLLGIVITAAMYARRQSQQRLEDMSGLALRLGWTFDPQKDDQHDDEYAHFEIFRRGHSRAAYNTTTGALTIAGRTFPAKMGDFTYKITSSTGKTTTTRTYHFSYLILHLPFTLSPDLLIRREGFFDKIAGFMGFDDIDFESAEFSKKFCVKSPDKRFAYDVIHPRMMEFLLRGSSAAIDIEQGRCCVSDGREKWTIPEFEARIGWITKFFELWPEHLVANLERR